MAATARALLLSSFNDLSINFHLSPTPRKPSFLLPIKINHQRQQQPIRCLISGVGNGGVADDYFVVSKREKGNMCFDREFGVICNMLKGIEPLDTSAISKGVSLVAKDSMKRTISTMLGILPSDQFSVTVKVERGPLDRLLKSSIITGYTLWNAEYRVSLMRNFDLSPVSMEESVSLKESQVLESDCEEKEGRDQYGGFLGEGGVPQSLTGLTPEALHYIQELKSELATVEKELYAQKLENTCMESAKHENNDLLDYLRSLETDMITELSRPSSLEVEEIIHQLVQNILLRFFKDEAIPDLLETKTVLERSLKEQSRNSDVEVFDTIGTSRDYLAKLLFWCMLLGHHLRGLENRLRLSCAVGLL